MSKTWDKIEKLTENLIASITGFKAGDENVKLCMDYAITNLKYHKYLDTDSRKIRRSFNGLEEKLTIHCEDRKAELLEEYVTKFLSIPAFELKESGETNTHWAVLSLLLQLSDSPLKSKFTPKEKQKPKAVEDDFDWYAYLMEGEEPYIAPLDELSDEDEDYDIELDDVIDAKEALPISSQISNTTLQREPQITGLDWLKNNVVVEYWKGDQNIEPSVHDSASFNLQWEETLTRGINTYACADRVHVTEYQVVREAIWLLFGTEDSFIFVQTDSGWTTRSNVHLTHVTHTTLENSLKPILRYGNIIRKVQNFLKPTSRNDKSSSLQTYQAFRGALSEFHGLFQQYLAKIEKSVVKQEKIVTISFLLETVSSRLRDFDVIERILLVGVDACAHLQDNAVRACSLLASMYHILTTCHILDDTCTQLNVVLPLWIKSCKPYLDKIDKWLYDGILYDPFAEFIIKINENVREEEYWDKAFTLHCTAPSPDDVSADAQFAPVFLLPILHEVIMGGKSMNLLQRLDKVEQVNPGSSRQTLYEAFVESISDYLGDTSQAAESDRSEHSSSAAAPALFMTPQHAQSFISKLTIHDPLLQLNFERLVTVHGSDDSHHADKTTYLAGDEVKLLCPIQHMLKHCLYSHVTQRYHTVSTHLLHVMKTDYQLFTYFDAIKRYYLMEAGDTMYDFCSELFEKLRHREEWKDVSSLNTIMQECLHERFPEDEDRLVVDIEAEDESASNRLPIKALQPLTLHFKIAWPVNAIINTKCMKFYNEIFRFLLMAKRAKYSLDGLRFTDLDSADEYEAFNESSPDPSLDSSVVEPPRQQLIHTMHMMRFKLLCFANSLHNYVMTRIIHSTTSEFLSDLSQAQNIDDVIRIHNTYILTLHGRCLQNKEVYFLRDLVIKVLNIAVMFCKLWNDGIHNISYKSVVDLDLDYCRCVQFISTFFNKVIRRGSFLHLEPLAFALESAYN